MHIDDEQLRVLGKRIIHTVAVVGIDIDIGYALHTMLPAQCLDGRSAVVEDTKPGGGPSAGMLQPGDRDKGIAAFTADDSPDPVKNTADDAGRRNPA